MGIDTGGATPWILTADAVWQADVVITMGCGTQCLTFPGKRYQDWELTDPAGEHVNGVRVVRPR